MFQRSLFYQSLYFAAMADCQHENDQLAILNLRQQSVTLHIRVLLAILIRSQLFTMSIEISATFQDLDESQINGLFYICNTLYYNNRLVKRHSDYSQKGY